MLVIEKLSYTEDVYDFEVADTHCFFANDILVHNCEISLNPFQFCNVTEINASDIIDQADFNARCKAGSFLGTVQAGYTDFHYLRPEWEETTKREALIGVGMTGIGSGAVLGLDLKEGANVVVAENHRVADIIGINHAARTTTIKPSGCLEENTKIKTSKGILSLKEIFEINDIDPTDENLGFIDIKEELFVYDMDNSPQLVTRLFNNGLVDTLTIEFEDDSRVVCTPNHKFLTKSGWKRADELSELDDIISF